MKLNHFSYSSISMFMRCPTQWYFRYVEELKIPPAVAQAQGSALHKAQEVNYRQKIETHEDMSLDVVLDVARDSFAAASEDCDWSQENIQPGEVIDQTIDLTKAWHQELAPAVQPIDVERKIRLYDPNWVLPLDGFIDVETEDTIIDLKTSNKKKTVDPETGLCPELERDIQSGIYLLEAYTQRKPQKFEWHVAVKSKTPTTQVVQRQTFNPQQVRDLVAHEQAAITTALTSGVFGAAPPDAWWCSERFCGYWHICPWGGKSATSVNRGMAADVCPSPLSFSE